MYFERTEHLDLPVSIQTKLLQEVDFINLQKTSSSGSVVQYQPTQLLQDEIYRYYQSFLNLVPDIPKIHIKKIQSNYKRVFPHIDKAQTTSIACLIRTDMILTTMWYEPNKDVEHLYRNIDSRYRNTKGIPVDKEHINLVAETKLKLWEMTIFDHNSIHSVENFIPGMDRIFFSIGFLNISHDDLVACYHRWINIKTSEAKP